MKPLEWVGSSKKDLLACPEDVQDTFGYALHLAQSGEKHDQAKPLMGFGGAGVLEVVEDWRSETYRAADTVKFGNAMYVLHVFQKKSKRGIAKKVYRLLSVTASCAIPASAVRAAAARSENAVKAGNAKAPCTSSFQ